jgi:hypothetical protein
VIGPLAQDMAVESLYATGERQKALQDAVALLKKYAPSVGFGRTRERRYLLGDVRGIMTDISCEGVPTGTSDACQSLEELLATPEEGVNAIPNWKLSLAANRMLNSQNQKLLRNYAKPAGWFTRKKKRKGTLRENLQRIQRERGCSTQPEEEEPYLGPTVDADSPMLRVPLTSRLITTKTGALVPRSLTGDPRAPTIATVPTTASNPPITVSNSSNSNSTNLNTLNFYGTGGHGPRQSQPGQKVALPETNRRQTQRRWWGSTRGYAPPSKGGARRTRKSRRGKKRQTRRRSAIQLNYD